MIAHAPFQEKNFGLTTLKLVGLWLLVVFGFAAYGYLGPGHSAQIRGATFSWRTAICSVVLCMELGVGVATCITCGMIILSRVRAGRLSRGLAIVFLWFGSVAGITAAGLFVPAIRPAFPPDWYLLRGEEEWGVAVMWGWTVAAAAIAFLVFTVLALASRHRL